MNKLTLTTREACEAAGVSAPTLRKWARMPGFPLVRAGRKHLILADAFRRWLEEQVGGEKV